MMKLGSSMNKHIGGSRVREDIAALYPPAEREKELEKFEKSKKGMTVKIVLAGIITAVAVWGISYGTGLLEPDGSIRRNAYGMGSRQAELIAVTKQEGKTGEEITVEIPERQYTKEETETLFADMLPELDSIVLAENESLNAVSTNLNFIKALPDYPFAVRWETDSYELIDADGTVHSEKAEKDGELVQIRADVSYEEFEREYIFHVRVIPQEKTEAEKWTAQLQEAVKQAEENTRYEDYFILPTVAGTEQIAWKEKKGNNSFVILALFLLAGAAVYAGKNQELHKEAGKRKKELTADYPEVVSKIVLLTGAGMSVRSTFFKIAADYKKKRETGSASRYAYEEIVYTCNEMDTGVAEAQAYVNWGKRCMEKQYIKLSMLLVQNLKKGSAGLMQSLREEVNFAFQEKKAGARRAGEEAGTKLLLPMGLMLLVVMVLIIVPAFSSFG